MLVATAPVVHVRESATTNAGDWLVRQYSDVLDIPALVRHVRRTCRTLDTQRFALGICLKHSVLDMLHADAKDPWTDEANAALVKLVDWSNVAASVLDRFSAPVLHALDYAAADACEVSARMAETEEELAGEALNNFRWLAGGNEFDAPIDPADVPASVFA